MTDLEPAPPEPTSASAGTSTWGLKQGIIFLGVVLVLLAVVGGVFHYCLARPVSRFDFIDPEQLRQNAKNLPPSGTWEIWQVMKRGLDRRTDQQYAERLGTFHLEQGFFVGLAMVGVVLIAVGAVGLGNQGARARAGRFTAQ